MMTTGSKTKRALFCLVLLVSFDTGMVAATAPPGGQTIEPESEAESGSDLLLATGRRTRYTVESGDTLSEIANDHGVTVNDLRRWNDIEGDFIRSGQVLTIRSSRRGSGGSRSRRVYIVERGDTLSRIAQHFDVELEDLIDWNRGINPDRIRIGQEIVVRVSGRGGSSASVGRPNRGRLSVSVQLENGAGYTIRTPSRSFGTDATVTEINQAFARIARRYPAAPELVIGDLSYSRGGRMRSHVSHQSGRDADIPYYTYNQESGSGFFVASPESLDVRLTWYLLHSFLATGHVTYIFVDYNLQEALYDYVSRRGASEEDLALWFQYPREGQSVGIIRAANGHDDHFHIRFDCPSSDSRCED